MTPEALAPDRSTSEDQLVRAHLHLASQAVHELARRLPSHVNRDDLSSAAMLGLAGGQELGPRPGGELRAPRRHPDPRRPA